jgi:hypothetical protein
LVSTLSRVCIFYMNFHLPYDRFINFLYEFLYDIWRVLSSLLLTCRIIQNLLLTCCMIWNLLLTFRMIGMSTRTLVVPILRFLLIFSFWDVTTMKRLTLNNQDIQAWPLLVTTVALTRVWVIFHMYEYCVIWYLLRSFFSYNSRIGADSFSGLMDSRRLIHKFFFSRMIGISLICCALSSVGFLCHQIHCQWQMRRRTKQLPIVSTTHLRINVATVPSWWTHLPGWITHHFFVVRFLYR